MKDVTFMSEKIPVKKDFLAYTKISVSLFVIGIVIFIYTWTGRNQGGESGLVFLAVASQVMMIISLLVVLSSLVGAKKSFDAAKRENRNSTAWSCLYINLICFTCMIVLWLSIYGLFWFNANRRSNALPQRSRVVAPKSRTAAPADPLLLPSQPLEIYSPRPIKALPTPPPKAGAESSPGSSMLWKPMPPKSKTEDDQ